MTFRIFVVAERYALTDEFIRAQNGAPGRWKVDYVPVTEPHRLAPYNGGRVYMIEPMRDGEKHAAFIAVFRKAGFTVQSVDRDQVMHH